MLQISVTLKATYFWCYSFCQKMGIVLLIMFIPSMLHCLLKKKIQFSFNCSNFCFTLSQGTCFTPNILSLPGTGAVCVTDSVTELHEIVLLIISMSYGGLFWIHMGEHIKYCSTILLLKKLQPSCLEVARFHKSSLNDCRPYI